MEIIEQTDKLTFLDGVKACLPTVFGYIGIGFAAGVVGETSKLSILEIFLLAAIVYAGASQFIISGLLALNSPISAIVFTAFLVNSRHALMSMTVAQSFKKNSFWNNIGIGSLLTDESFAVAMNRISNKKRITSSWMHGLNIMAYLTWIIACIGGAIIGSWLPDPEALGIDFALLAMFIGLLYLQLVSDKGKTIGKSLLVMLTVACLVFLCMRFTTPELSVLIATLLGCFIGVVTER